MGEKPNARMITTGMLAVVDGSSIPLTSIGDSHPFLVGASQRFGPRKSFSMETQLLNHSFHHFWKTHVAVSLCFNQMNQEQHAIMRTFFHLTKANQFESMIEIVNLQNSCESIQRWLRFFGVKLGTSYATSSGKTCILAGLDGLRLFAGALCGKRLLGRISWMHI